MEPASMDATVLSRGMVTVFEKVIDRISGRSNNNTITGTVFSAVFYRVAIISLHKLYESLYKVLRSTTPTA
jgi:hypothetical protein